MTTRTVKIADKEHNIVLEKTFLRKALQNNEYSLKNINYEVIKKAKSTTTRIKKNKTNKYENHEEPKEENIPIHTRSNR